MSTAVARRPRVEADMVTTLEVGPGGLARFLELVPRHPGRIYYRNGSLTIVSPTYKHERGVTFFGEIVNVIAVELEIPFHITRSTLFFRDDLEKGVEPDASFYFEDRHAVLEVDRSIDLSHYPAPALVLEAVWTHGAGPVLSIYAAMGVPEAWVYDIPSSSVTFLQLDENGRYSPTESSLVFPFLTSPEVAEQLRSVSDEADDGLVLRRFQTWAREVLGPRRGNG